jgi:hypothetical protein
MPFKHNKISRKCKYCNKDALKNIRPDGRNKGFYKTCGSKECLSMQYKDKSVCQKKAYINKNIVELCKHCNKEFVKEMFKQKWCKICVPNKIARSIMQRYNISYPEYLEIIKENSGKCPICYRKMDNPVVDHDHKTGKVRGIICNHCNTCLNLIEDSDKLQRALNYLNK